MWSSNKKDQAIFGVQSIWWLSSPNTGNSNNMYNVTASGTLNNNNANNSNGVSLDCMSIKHIIFNKYDIEESKFFTDKEQETSYLCKELQTLPKINHLVNQNRRRKLHYKNVGFSTSCDSFPFQQLVKSVKQCCRGVSWKNSVTQWKLNYLSYCIKLYNQLKQHKYKLCQYQQFIVKSPKLRVIKSLQFRDRVVQRTMCNNGLYYDLTKDNIYDNGACQKNKGTSFVLDRLKVMLGRYYRKHGNNGWVLRLDIHKFFDSIPHDKLIQMVKKKVTNPDYVERVIQIINSFGEEKGIGLGSQISQLLAISYLSQYDHLIKERFKIKVYTRYSDDIVIVHQNKQHLQQVYKFTKEYLNSIGLELNPKSTLHKLNQGINFLKFKYFVTNRGKVVYFKTNKEIKRAKKVFIKMVRCYKQNKKNITLPEIANSIKCWSSFVSQGCKTYRIINLKKDILKELSK